MKMMLRSDLRSRALGVVIALCAACSSDAPDGQAPSAAGSGGTTAGSGGAAGTGGAMSSGGSGGAPGSGGSGGALAGSGGEQPPSDAATPDASDSGDDGDGVTSERGMLVPTAEWPCGMATGIPAPVDGTLVLELEMELEPALQLGATPFGERTIRTARAGAAAGELEGTVLEGGLEWELSLPSGARELESRHVLRASDGTLLYVRGCGAGAGNATRMVMDLEVRSTSAHAAFQSGTHVATREAGESSLRYAIYRFPEGSAIDPTAPSRSIVRSDADRALRPQSWTCEGPPAGSSEGAQLLEATVGIGGSLDVGEAQHGSRNIIPITGGTFAGMGSAQALEGDVVPGGADFQLTPPGGSFQLEARYVLRAEDGTLIAVRNCGGIGGTTPLFEAPLASPFAYLNEGDYFGRIGISIGAVIISVYEREP